ncbi:MAG: hypothetical protein ACFCVK_06585 [Acidimicrobiales bacterium]
MKTTRRPSIRARAAAVMVAAGAVALAACAGEDATPLSEYLETSITTPHLLSPTDEMRELAAQQCRDDPELDRGVVNAVDPADDDRLLSSVEVDCNDVDPSD